MRGTMTIEGKMVGRRRRLWDGWSVPLPVAEGETLSLAALLEGLVRQEVAAFQARQAGRRLPHLFDRDAIAGAAEEGRVVPIGRRTSRRVEVEQAVAVALQAFEDGLFYVFVDERQIETLDAPVALQDGSRVLLLRLVALVGG